MLNILSVSSLYPHAAMPNFGIFVANRLRAMQASGKVNITLITPFPDSPLHKIMSRYKGARNPGPLHEVDIGQFNRYNVPYFSIPVVFKSSEYHSLLHWCKSNADRLWRMHGPFDVIDVHWGYPDLPAAQYLAELWQIPLNITLRGMETFYPGDAREMAVRSSVEQCQGIISLSQQMLNHATTFALVDNCQTRVIVNGADPLRFGHADQGDARDLLGIPKESIMLLGIGSLIYRKGFQCVITALARLIKEHPELHYYVVGAEASEIGFSQKLKTLSAELGIESNVHIVGPVLNKDLKIWYNAADWFVLSSAGEGSPNVLSEALMSGCPCISTPVGAAADLLALSSRSGFMFPESALAVFDDGDEAVGAMEAWYLTLQELMSTTPRFSARERKLLASDMAAFTWDWCANSTIEHLKEVVRQHSRG